MYETAPLYEENQPPFLNTVARFETNETPQTILKRLEEIEQRLRKAPSYRFGPRTIDLDFLLYDELVLPSKKKWPAMAGSGSDWGSEKLCIPHIRMHERRFVLEPLCELLDPHAKHPVLQKSWQELLAGTLDQACEQTDIALGVMAY